jgi:hypothetical protein
LNHLAITVFLALVSCRNEMGNQRQYRYLGAGLKSLAIDRRLSGRTQSKPEQIQATSTNLFVSAATKAKGLGL